MMIMLRMVVQAGPVAVVGQLAADAATINSAGERCVFSRRVLSDSGEAEGAPAHLAKDTRGTLSR
jgi:hypothetical protein